MKISPVVGTPTISNAPNTGNSPEKLARLKAIASGKTPEALGAVALEEKDKDKQRVITMKTNHTVNREEPIPEAPQEPIAEGIEPETAKIDANVQANGTAEATQPLSPQFAALAKQRRALQVKERELADKEKALSGPSRTELEERIKTQPLSVLQELGVTYDQLTQDILAAQGGITPEIQALKAEIKALKEGVDKTFTDKDAAAETAVLTEIRRNVDKMSFQGDEYELIRETKSQPDVVDLIKRTWKATGEVLDEAEAMRLVEEDLVNESIKIAKLKKVQGKLTPQEPLQPQANDTAPSAPVRGAMRTLTNKDSAKPAMSRRQRAILAAQGNLPKG